MSLEVADAADASNSRSYSFVVTDVNEAPAFDAETGTRNVDENLLVGANVGAPFVATDPEDDTLSYLVVVGAAYTGGFTVTNGGGQIQTGQKLNFEAAGSHLVRIQVSDPQRPDRHHRCDGYGQRRGGGPRVYGCALRHPRGCREQRGGRQRGRSRYSG